MLSSLLSLVAALAAGPALVLVRYLRRRQLGRDGVLSLNLSHDAPGRTSLETLVATVSLLRAMREDALLRTVILHVRSPALGHAALQELHEALGQLRAAGKRVLVHLEHAGNAELLLASAADRVYLAPAAEVMLTGVGAQLVFYGDALERLGVRAEFEAAGAYKSFGEPYSRGYATPENREAVQALVEDLDRQLVQTMARARGVDEAAVRGLIEATPAAAEEAVRAGLVDELAWPDEVQARISEQLGREVEPVGFRRYARLLAIQRALARWGRRDPAVVVVHLEGPVVHGTEPSGGANVRIDADRVVPVLDGLRQDEQARAVVLYVDSPGGSALASDLIARAVQRLAAQKPVVAAFGDVSASGGYYVSAPAAEIVALPGTITGSIGVVGGKLSFGAAAASLGVHHEPVVSSDSALLLSPWRPFRDGERERFRRMLDRTYTRFLDVVASGRKRPVEQVEPHAQGRVWTGRQARDRGLVDHLGGLSTAIERARALAGLAADPPVRHVAFPPPRLRVLAQMLGRAQQTAPDLVTLGLASLGEPGRRLLLLRDHAGQAMALLPWVLLPSRPGQPPP